MTDRRAEIAAGLAAVHERIAVACAAAERPLEDVTLIVVTKTYPASDIAVLASLGVTDIGENRDQEARDKASVAHQHGMRLHFIGQCQTNKAPSVVTYASLVHSLDRARLATALEGAARGAARVLPVLVQVGLDRPGTPGRAGADPQAVQELANLVAQSDSLRLAGVMGVAPLGEPPDVAFARLAGIARSVRGRHPDATVLSAGMSADMEAAIHNGATHVRIGAAILGNRAPLR